MKKLMRLNHIRQFVIAGVLVLLSVSAAFSGTAERLIAPEFSADELSGRFQAMGLNQSMDVRTYLIPRPVFPAPRFERITEDFAMHVLVLKFDEGTRVRLRDGFFVVEERSRDEEDVFRMDRLGLLSDEVINTVEEFNEIMLRSDAIIEVERHFERSGEELDFSRINGQNRVGRELADLNLYYTVYLNPELSEEEVLIALDHFNALPAVESCYPVPIPRNASLDAADRSKDGSKSTPDFTYGQHYKESAPNGIDADFASLHTGGEGSGVDVIDIEGGWNLDHEDLPSTFYKNGVNWGGDHGTAVIGIIRARDNSYGMTGILPHCRIGVGSVSNWHGPYALAAAIDNAADELEEGDVILIEQHLKGPDTGGTCTCNCSQYEYIAVEYWSNYYDSIAAATANGIIVVEAAGNGSVSLDDSAYDDRFDRTERDSGAIIVGAQDLSGFTLNGPACWTNYGSRVDVSGWGDQVWTLGYGDLHSGSGKDEYYTSDFGGTSSASPIVVGAVGAIQGYLYLHDRERLDPMTMRALLTQTGTGQEPSSKHIGPLPNIRNAIHELSRMSSVSGDFNGDGRPDLAVGNPWAEVDGDPGAGLVRVYQSDGGALSLYDYYEISQGSTDLDVWGSPEDNDCFGFALAAGNFDGDAYDDLAIGVPFEDWEAENEGFVIVLYGSSSGLNASDYVLVHQDNGINLNNSSEDNDLLGFSMSAGDIDGDGYDDLAVGSPGEGYNTTANTGMVHVAYGSSIGISSCCDKESRFYTSAHDNFMGRAVTVEDLDDDGYADLCIGIPGWDESDAEDVGHVIVYCGSSSGLDGTFDPVDGDILLLKSDDAIDMSSLRHSRMGEALAAHPAIGDEGPSLLFVGCPGYRDYLKWGAGAVLEVYNIDSPESGLLFCQQDSDSFEDMDDGVDEFDLVGSSLAAGDFDADGVCDLAIGHPGDGSDVDAGMVTILYGWAFMGVMAYDEQNFTQDDFMFETSEFGEMFGASLTAVDKNSDGDCDLFVLSPGEDASGDPPAIKVNTLYGSSSGMKTMEMIPRTF